RSVAELEAVLAGHPDATILAGGTDVGLWVTKQHRALPMLVSVNEVAELRRVETAATHIEIGAAAPYSDILPAVAPHYPDFGVLLRRLGSTQIRNAGTMGGNVANGSPIGDSMPALIACGAT